MAKKKSKRTPGKKVVRKSQVKKAGRKSATQGSARAGTAEVTRALELLEWVHGMTGKLAAGFDEGRMFAQPDPSTNHLVWQLGHLAMTYAWFAGMLDGRTVAFGERFEKPFGMGSKPVGDPAAYPPHAEVRRVFDEQYTRFITAARRLDDASGLEAPGMDTGGFVKNKLDAIYKCVWHEGWHQGQMSQLRRALGMPSVM